jgi:drug/metabolite transporter (DMT)-like permease
MLKPKWNQTTLGFLFVILSGVGFGFLGVFGRLAFQSGLSVGELLTYRFFLAAALLFLGLLVFKPSLLKMPLNQVFISIALGIFGYAVFSTLYFKAIEGISVPLAALLLFTFPIFVNLGAHFILHERMKRLQVVSLLIACIGLSLLLWGPLIVNSPAAVFYALTAAIAYAIYVLVSGKLQKNVPAFTSSLYVITSAALALYLFHQPQLNKLSHFSSLQLFLIAGIAIVSTIAPLTLFLAGLQRLTSSKASIVVMIEPVVAAIAAAFLLNEHLTSLQLLGSLLVITALVMNAFK